MTVICTVLALLCAVTAPAPSPSVGGDGAIWTRRYHDGETLRYVMDGVNQGRRYRVRANARVIRDPAGVYVEQIAWSDLSAEGAPVALGRASADFRQVVSLAPEHRNAVPPLNALDAGLIGPVTDLLAFYSDLWLAARMSAALRSPGDHVAYPYGKPASWADGTVIVIGQDSIDFDVLLAGVDRVRDRATIVVRHVPPTRPQVDFPARWMTVPVAGTANNWIEVRKRQDGTYDAEVGKETFESRLVVSLTDGRILEASLDNPVEAVRRNCADAALADCGAAVPIRIQRTIALRLEP